MRKPKKLYEVSPDVEKMDLIAKHEYREDIEQLIAARANLKALKTKYRDVLEQINKYSKLEEELTKMLFPTIYFSTSYHHTSKQPFIVGRSVWKKGLNDFIQISVYVGPLAQFKFGIEDDSVKKIALDKMRKKIKESILK